jgi:hypothetical protein
LNAYDILVNDWVVFTDSTLPGGPQTDSPVAADDSAATDSATDSVAADDSEEEGSGS